MIRKLTKFLFFSLIGCFAALVLVMTLLKWVNPPTSAFMLAHDINHLTSGEKAFSRAVWVPLTQIPKQVQIAVIAAEDQKFAHHNGIDIDATLDAIEQAMAGNGRRGGSTITQQVVKNMFLWEGRSYLRKALEIPMALLLEQIWSKQRILEVYLNIAQFGVSDFGVYRGSRVQFNKPLEKLSLSEAALLASILPAPSRYTAKHPTTRLNRKKNRVLTHIRRIDGIRYLTQLK